MKLNKDKLKFRGTDVPCMEHLFSLDGLAPDCIKICSKVAKDIPEPEHIKEL